jgi:hypothetical protein
VARVIYQAAASSPPPVATVICLPTYAGRPPAATVAKRWTPCKSHSTVDTLRRNERELREKRA